jgi:O-antigen/teichoic acid export membrane protein
MPRSEAIGVTGQPQRRTGQLLARLAGPAGLVMAGLGIYYLFTALTLIVLARRLLPIEYGQYTATVALAALTVVLPGYGLDVWLLARSGLAPAQLAACWRQAMQLRLALLALWAVILIGIGQWLPAETYPPLVFATVVAATGVESLATLTIAALRSQQRHRQVAVVQSTWAATLLGAALLLPLAPGRLVWFTSTRLLLAGGALAWLTLLMARRIAVTQPSSSSFRTLLTEGRPFLFSEAASLIYMRVDLVLVGLLLGSAASAIYGAALSVLNMAFVLPLALFYAATPALTHTYVHAPAEFATQAWRETLRQVVVGLLLTVGIAVAAPLLTWLYGASYADAVGVLRLLAPIGLLRCLNFALAAQLIARQRQVRRTQIQVAVAAFAIVGNLLVLPIWGVTGAALIFVVCELALCLGYAFGLISTNSRSMQY